MHRKPFVVLAVAVGLLMVSGSVFAHHGDVNYESDRLTTVEGTVARFDLINPHGRLYFNVKDENGNVQEWYAELSAINTMRRLGWNKVTLKLGDTFTATGHRARDGSYEMRLVKAVLANGTEISARRPR